MALQTERQKGAHLLRRFGLGASESELDYYLKDGGLNGAIDKLLNYENTDEGFKLDIDSFRNGKNNNISPQAVGIWWTARMLTTQRPLQEKMTLFWHNHFATSGEKVTQGGMMYVQNELLRQNATGNFRDMLMQVSKDPAMLFWLDNQYNVKGHPNENFAREVMELFTLGIGNYTEHDIQEGARAFTGWSIQRTNRKEGDDNRPQAEFLFRPRLHDDGDKTYLGVTGNLTGDDVINHLCDLPRCAEFLTNKLWKWFVYPNPDKDLIGRLADKFRQSNLNIKELLRLIMTSPEFYSDKAERAVYKNPVDFVVVSLRELGIGQILTEMIANVDQAAPNPLARVAPAAQAYQAMKQMGMQLLFPPDVSGWAGGSEWVSTATMVERISWANKVFGRARFGSRFTSYRIFEQDPSPKGIAAKLVSIFDAPIPSAKMKSLEEAAEKAMGGKLTPQNANGVAAAVSRLIFAAPEYQFE
ncbi:MAG TPA: DUF1800 domain-containing protein [Fimbriimonadaceae bacterium]|nr:DUF1800 domain-containing protein [Fimbriimonadaceae bacterium]